MVEVKVLECHERRYKEVVYYTFMVCDPHEDEKDRVIPISSVNGEKPYKVGSIAPLVFYRNKEFKLCCRMG